jgi:transposase InsO family protein
VGLLLVEKGLVDLELVSKKLKVTPRTLRSWKKCAKDGAFKKRGRPKKFKFSEKLKMIKLVFNEYELQGRPGWRPIAVGLKGKVPVRMIQEVLKKIKLKERVKKREVKKNYSTAVEVLHRNVIWTQDGTHLGRMKNKKEVQAQIIKDRCTLATIGFEVGAPANSENVIGMFQKISNREFPLVWMTDNGPSYISKSVQQYMEENLVIHLKNLPHTPEHNGGCEIRMKEIKAITGLGEGVVLEEYNTAYVSVETAVWTLNNFRLHGSKGFRTSKQLEECEDNIELGEIRKVLYTRY